MFQTFHSGNSQAMFYSSAKLLHKMCVNFGANNHAAFLSVLQKNCFSSHFRETDLVSDVSRSSLGNIELPAY
jgi:hypothetical protein